MNLRLRICESFNEGSKEITSVSLLNDLSGEIPRLFIVYVSLSEPFQTFKTIALIRISKQVFTFKKLANKTLFFIMTGRILNI